MPDTFAGTAVYDDRWLPIFSALGALTVERATDVEWEAGAWVARLRRTGAIIARGHLRADVIRAEILYLNARLAAGQEV